MITTSADVYINSTSVSKPIMATTQTTNKQPTLSFTPQECNDTKFIGTNCNISNNPCDMADPCKNAGICRKIHYGYNCTCPSGFNGTHCEFDYRPCKPYTCSNHGICNETSNTTFNYTCDKGWRGLNCESMINFCKINPCLNRGVCRPLLLNFICECLEGHSGHHCENTAKKIIIRRIVSKSFAYIVIIAIVCVAMFVIIMDILKHCFGIDPVEEERERIRQKKLVNKRKSIGIQRSTGMHKRSIRSSFNEITSTI